MSKAGERRRIEEKNISQLTAFSSHKHKLSNFPVFLACMSALISFLILGVLLLHFQRKTEKNLEAARSDLYSMADALSWLETRIDVLQKLAVETKSSESLLENQLKTLSKQITSLHSDLISGAVRSSIKSYEKGNLPPQKQYSWHEVRAGETLYSIAKKYEMSMNQLALANKLADKEKIYTGQRILILTESLHILE